MTLTESGDHAGRFKCFACDFHGDLVDVYRKIYGFADDEEGRAEALREVCSALGLVLDEPKKKKPAEMTEEEKAMELARRIQSDIRAAQLNTGDDAFIDYLTRRGIPLDIARRFHLGFLPLWQHPKTLVDGKKVKPTPRLIIPTGNTSYLARATRDGDTLPKQKAGAANLFNIAALASSRPVFICEGEIDAISFYVVGAEAIGIGGTSGRAELISELKKRKKKERPTLILALDNDPAGEKATAELISELEKERIDYFVRNPYGEHKDANEALVSDPDAFFSEVKRAENAEFEECSNLAWLTYVKETNTNPPPLIETGFSQLDALLGGGIKGDELVFFGGVSSSGKSAVCLQMVDQMAMAGRKILVFSAEMSRRSIMNRSLSRETTNGDGFRYTAQEVAGYGMEKGAMFQRVMAGAYDRYAKYAENIVVFDMSGGSASLKPSEIKKTIQRFVNVNRGEKPLVFVDYLQILPPDDDKGSDIRASINRAIEIFAGIAHGLQVPIIMISSLSRENYTAPLNLAAFKESGNIEYGADIVLGLQFECIHEPLFLSTNAKDTPAKWARLTEEKFKNPRKVEISLIKRRDGKGEGRMLLDYDPMHNLFTPNQSDEDFLAMNYGDGDNEAKRKARERLTGHRFSEVDDPETDTTATAKPRRRNR